MEDNWGRKETSNKSGNREREDNMGKGKLEQSMMGAMYEEGELGMTHIYSHSI